MLESSKIFVEHVQPVAKIFEPRPNSRAFATAGSAMTTGLALNGCSSSKKNNILKKSKKDCLRQFGLRRPQRINAL